MIWRCRDRTFDLGERTLVMGIVNVTPDSFADGGRFFETGAAVARARQLADEGADLVDLGAESTRPGAEPVAPGEQIRRLEPVLEALPSGGVALSVDTASAEVAAWALARGVVAVNDVTALADPGMAAVVAASGAGVVLMHMRGRPRTMQDDPRYADVAEDVTAWLRVRLEGARRAGIAPEQVVLDPGIGFGKTARHNFELVARLEEPAALGRPLLVGVSRKRFLGGSDALPPEERLEGTLAALAVATYLGARIVRVHDVAAARRAVEVADALRAARRAREPQPES